MNGIREEISTILRSRVVVWLRTKEEVRAERTCLELAEALRLQPVIWRVTTGLLLPNPGKGAPELSAVASMASPRGDRGPAACTDPRQLLSLIVQNDEMSVATDPEFPQSLTTLSEWFRVRDSDLTAEAAVRMASRRFFILEDLGTMLNDPMAQRRLRDVVRTLPTLSTDVVRAVVVIDPKPAPDIPGIVEVDFPLPDQEDLGAIVESVAGIRPEILSQKDEIIRAISGLAAEDAAVALKRSILAGALDIGKVAQFKKALIGSDGALEWFDPDPRGLDGVGGLELLKRWLLQRRRAFTKEAQDYGLPLPKGCLVVGVPGTGKSLTAKCVASAWGLPLLRFDVGAIFGKFVGESESKMRDALKTAGAIAPAIVWIDELEKAFAGVGGSGAGDSGTTSRVFGTFLTWLQEGSGGIFVIATANNVADLPPEFTRAGRFDAIWWVDLPSSVERVAIVDVMCRKYKRCSQIDPGPCVLASDGLTGAEIEEGFKGALNLAFEDDRDPTTEDVVESLKEVVPVTQSYGEKLEVMRAWARKGARQASISETRAARQNSGSGIGMDL